MAERDMTAGMLQFIQKSPTAFHAIASLKEMLEAEGYQEWKESEDWNAKIRNTEGQNAEGQNAEGRDSQKAGKYYVVRNDSSLIAINFPENKEIKGFHIAASHSDSPTFKVKEAPEMLVEKQYVKLNTEKYGGLILSTWMDRALSVAGRIVVKKEDGFESRLVNIDKDLLVIPNLAVHMNREINNGVAYNPQVDMLPLMAGFSEGEGKEPASEKGALLSLIAKEAGVEAEDILGHDLYLYVREGGKRLGMNGEFIFSPRLDDLQCAYVSMKAFLESEPNEYVNVCAVFDNEEVGSGTKQGADSTFLEDVLVRSCEAFGMTMNDYRRLVPGSFLVSADNAHAVHPNHPEKADPTNRPYLNGGIVIKFHGSQKYTSDAVSAAKMKDWCNRAGVPFQTFANRSDATGGSTLGNISTAHVSVSSVDIGLPQLAMHSAVETAGSLDTEYGIRALREFYGE